MFCDGGTSKTAVNFISGWGDAIPAINNSEPEEPNSEEPKEHENFEEEEDQDNTEKQHTEEMDEVEEGQGAVNVGGKWWKSRKNRKWKYVMSLLKTIQTVYLT